jgi:hypothetical protein
VVFRTTDIYIVQQRRWRRTCCSDSASLRLLRLKNITASFLHLSLVVFRTSKSTFILVDNDRLLCDGFGRREGYSSAETYEIIERRLRLVIEYHQYGIW